MGYSRENVSRNRAPGIPVAAGLLFPFFGVLLSPIIAGDAMAASSITVVTNANRPRFFEPGPILKGVSS